MSSLLLVITGASRGLGRAIAIAFVKHSIPTVSHIRLVLVARSKEDLLETRQLVMEAAPSNLSLRVSIHNVDLSNLDELDTHIDNLLLLGEEAQPIGQFRRVILINNAGSLGPLGPCKDFNSLRNFRQAIDFNVTSSLWLSVRFVQEFLKSSKSCSEDDERACVVVNISSLCAIEPFPTMASYCAGKAARDMFHATFAKEFGNHQNVKFLNYAPGACETDMTCELSTCEVLDDNLKQFFRTSQTEGTLVKPQDTSRKLVKLVFRNEFESGKHIDYWDVTDDGKPTTSTSVS